MDLIVRTPLMADKIKELLDGQTLENYSFSYVDKKGIDMTFHVTGDGAETAGDDIAAIVKGAIKSTDYGKGIYFSVLCK